MTGRLYLLAAVFAVMAAGAFAIDLPVARLLREQGVPGDLGKLVYLAEVMAHGIGVACILLTLYVVDVKNRRRFLRIVVMAFGSGMMANVVKFCVARARPRTGDPAGVWDSFAGWFPWFSWPEDRLWNNDWQSFPSGHAAVAVGFAIGLSIVYPRGRWLFVTFAALAAMQRMVVDAHYASDVLAATSLACLWCGCCYDTRSLGRWFDRFEAGGRP